MTIKNGLRLNLGSKKTKLILATVPVIILAGFLGFNWYDSKKVVIKTNDQSAPEGQVTLGASVAQKTSHIQTHTQLTFESSIIKPEIKNANAAILKWSQKGGESGVSVELRTNNGGVWSEWSEPTGADDRKDGASVPRAALILGDDIKSVQYRFKLEGTERAASPVIDTSATTLEMVDTTKGPEPIRPKSTIEKILGALRLGGSVQAVADGPPVYSRGAWGAPEPDSSPRWEPEYRPLSRVIVHHTATPFSNDVGAQLRAIWHYHANSLGWGDIGYNYIVDHGGNIFQGRYYDQTEADRQNAEVVGGHAYENNLGTTGISVLGDFTNATPTSAAMRSVANIAAFKMHKFDTNPAAGTSLVGHRDVGQTACPGSQFYSRLNTVRTISSEYYYKYSNMYKLDSKFVDEGFNDRSSNGIVLNPGQTVNAYIDIKNMGADTWSNTGSHPIYFGTDMPQDRVSSFTNSSWISSNRPSSFSYKVDRDTSESITASAIAPGEIARFEFMLQAPYRGGVFREHFQLLSEGRTWFLRNQGIQFTINVAEPTYTWQPVSQAAYTDATRLTPVSLNAIKTNQRFYVENTVKNTSNQVWRRTGSSPIRLGTNTPQNRPSSFQDLTWPAVARPALLTQSVVNPGENGIFGYWMQAPSVTGQYKEYFNILAENQRWFTDYGLHWLIIVQNP